MRTRPAPLQPLQHAPVGSHQIAWWRLDARRLRAAQQELYHSDDGDPCTTTGHTLTAGPLTPIPTLRSSTSAALGCARAAAAARPIPFEGKGTADARRRDLARHNSRLARLSMHVYACF